MFPPFQFSATYWGKIRKKDSKPATLRFVLLVHSCNGDLCTRNCPSRGLELSLTIRGWGWGWSRSEEGVGGCRGPSPPLFSCRAPSSLWQPPRALGEGRPRCRRPQPASLHPGGYEGHPHGGQTTFQRNSLSLLARSGTGCSYFKPPPPPTHATTHTSLFPFRNFLSSPGSFSGRERPRQAGPPWEVWPASLSALKCSMRPMPSQGDVLVVAGLCRRQRRCLFRRLAAAPFLFSSGPARGPLYELVCKAATALGCWRQLMNFGDSLSPPIVSLPLHPPT